MITSHIDASGRTCPECQSDEIGYVNVPEHRRIHGNVTEHFGKGRDYRCHNCDAEWFMQPNDDAAEQAKPVGPPVFFIRQDGTHGEYPPPDECHCPQHGSWIAADDVKRLVREIDVYLNGDGAAKQASLCDIAGQLRRYSQERGPLFPAAEQAQAGEI